MKRYIILTAAAAALAVTAFLFNESRDDIKPCRDGWPFHPWSSWEVAGKSTRTFGRDRLLLKRHCSKCRQVQTKESQ